VKLLLPVGKVDGTITIGQQFLHRAVGKDALFLPIWVDILDRLVGKSYLLGAIGIVLLTLVTRINTITHTAHYQMVAM